MINFKLFLPVIFLFTIIPSLFGQAPEGINYQAVARDETGNVLSNQVISVRFSIRKNSPVDTIVYQETHSATTNEFGLFTLAIGEGSPVLGTLASVEWATHSCFLQVEIDDGSGYVSLGSTQFLSVPYALYAKEAGNGGGAGDDWGMQVVQTDTTLAGDGTTTNVLGLAQQGATSGEVLMWNGNNWAPAAVSGGGGFWTKVGSDIHYSSGSVGVNTSTPLTGLHVGDSTDVLFGKAMSGGPDNRLMWISDKGALRAGRVVSTNWDPDSIGQYSIALGDNSKATDRYTVALGRNTVASGLNAIAIGGFVTASGDNATAMGTQTTASGIYTTALGRNTTASGTHAFASGRNSEASGNYGTAMGYGTIASGGNALATGYNTTASGISATAMGHNSTANDLYATAMGRNALASGKSSVAIGEDPIASGDYSLATGNGTWAAGNSSTALGDDTYASGNFSTAMGASTTAPSGYETVIGRYNTNYFPATSTGWNGKDRLFVVGNGDSASGKSDALVILKNGYVGIGSSNPQRHVEINASDPQPLGDGVLHVGYNGSTAGGVAIYGKSDSVVSFGRGGLFEGNTGIVGIGRNSAGASGKTGVSGEAFGFLTAWNIGIDGLAAAAKTNYGVRSQAAGTDSGAVSYAFWGQAINSPSTDNYAGYFSGDVHISGTLTQPSDQKFKNEIKPFSGALSKVKQIKTYNYRYRQVEGMNLSVRKQIGFIAQEMEEVIPELVKNEVNVILPEESSGEEPLVIKYKGINYLGMIPVLTQAIKEQQEIIEEQQTQIEVMQQRLSNLESQ